MFATYSAYFGTMLITKSISGHLYRDYVIYAAIEIPSLFILEFIVERYKTIFFVWVILFNIFQKKISFYPYIDCSNANIINYLLLSSS